MHSETVRVWDPLVRVFHWGLVATVAVAWLSGDDWETLHVIAGYGVAGLVAFRLVWGVIGGRHARFAGFVRGPATVLAYLRDMAAGRERRYLGHNPAGAVMVLALLAVLGLTAYTGWLVERDAGEFVEDLHEVLANGLLLLIVLHVGGVIVTSLRHHENLVRSMITGDKRAPGKDDVV